MRNILALLFLFLLAACEAQSTPAPAIVVATPTEAVEATLPPPTRYGISANAIGYVADIDTIAEVALAGTISVENEPIVLGEDYDIVVAFGELDGWTLAPNKLHVALLINTNLPPLDEDAIAEALRRSINPVAVINALDIASARPEAVETIEANLIRIQLANQGYPDGFELALAYAHTPGENHIQKQLANSNFMALTTLLSTTEVVSAINQNRIHLALVSWTSEMQRETWLNLIGEDNFIDLYSLPISYQAIPDLPLTFTENGFPIPER